MATIIAAGTKGRAHTVPDVASDTFALIGATQTLTGKSLTAPAISGTSVVTGPLSFATITPSGTAGSLMTTGSTWVAFPTAGACGLKLLLENTCDTGEFATVRMRARANNTTASGNGASSIGTTTCYDASASAIDHEYGNLTAVNACVQPNALNQTVDATNIVCALYGRVDRTGTSVGRTWVNWIDTHQETKSGAGDYLVRWSHNGTVANDGVVTLYNGGRMPYLINFEDVAGLLSTSASGTFTKTHKIAVKIAGDATAYYIQLGTIA